MDQTSPIQIDSQWCPECGAELAFTGIQPAGIGQFFCHRCRYRHDRYVGQVEATA